MKPITLAQLLAARDAMSFVIEGTPRGENGHFVPGAVGSAGGEASPRLKARYRAVCRAIRDMERLSKQDS